MVIEERPGYYVFHDLRYPFWRAESLAAILYCHGAYVLAVVDDDKELWLVLHYALLKLAFKRNVDRVGKLHYNDSGVAL